MANNRQIPTLGMLAFEALLRERQGILIPRSKQEYLAFQKYKLKIEIQEIMDSIAEGKKVRVINVLTNNPQLASLAQGTVKTPSGHTIKNVSAIQLAYVLEDEEIGEILIPYLDSVPGGKAKAMQELAVKIAEVKAQEAAFEDYDYTELVSAISADTQLKNTGKANPRTLNALNDLREHFQPCVIEKGRPFNLRHIKKFFEVYEENWSSWNVKQLTWSLEQINDYLLGLVPPCVAYAFSNGLKKIVEDKQPLKRSYKLENDINKDELNYYDLCSCYSEGVKERLEFINIYYGAARRAPRGELREAMGGGCCWKFLWSKSDSDGKRYAAITKSSRLTCARSEVAGLCDRLRYRINKAAA